MANTKARKPAPAEEQRLANDIEAIKKQIGGKTPTQTQKDQLAAKRDELGGKRFVRIANKRVPKLLKGLQGLGNLSGAGYRSTEAQRKAIFDALTAELKAAESKLSGQKKTETGFTLPTT